MLGSLASARIFALDLQRSAALPGARHAANGEDVPRASTTPRSLTSTSAVRAFSGLLIRESLAERWRDFSHRDARIPAARKKGRRIAIGVSLTNSQQKATTDRPRAAVTHPTT